MAPNEKSNPPPPSEVTELQLVKFITEKNASFRTYHADGSWGMVSHSGNIQLNFYVERPELPKSATYEMDKNGTVVKAVDLAPQSDGKNIIIIRDYQSAVAMTLSAARQVHATLGNFIKIAEDMAKGQNTNEQQS